MTRFLQVIEVIYPPIIFWNFDIEAMAKDTHNTQITSVSLS